MIEKLVKNRTPYLGKMVLKFEKNPYYTSGKDGKLNKVHLNLGFTKLVTRFKPKQVMEGYSNIDPKKIELIEKYTGGVIGTHTFGKDDEYTLDNSFLTKDGVYIDNIDTAWWYYINKFYVCKEYPHGVAIKLKSYEPTIVLKNSIGDEYENFVTEQIENDNVEGFHGYTHRGGSTFKIGDRLFDAEYIPVVDDYDRKEFEGYWKEYAKSYSKADDFDKKSIYGDGIKAVIPFNRRGKQVIKDWDQARQAAINISKDLS